jgi:lipoyl(octanoyl) transferase
LTKEYNFRFSFTLAWSGLMNMEADRYLGEVITPDFPVVRFYTWDKPTISFGCNQNPTKRIDLASCQRDHIPVVQRPTGGRELLHGHDLCYCVAMPHAAGTTGLQAKQIFARITDVLIAALFNMGITAEWRSLSNRPRTMPGPCFAQTDAGEITVAEKKLVASAQRVFERCTIQEGSIPLVRPIVELINYLNTPERDSMRLAMDANTAYLQEQIDGTIPIETVVEHFKLAFEKHFSSQAGPADELMEDFKRSNKSVLWYHE